MWKRIRLVIGGLLCVVFCLVLLFVAAGIFLGGSASASGTLQTGRTISASSDSWYLSLETQTDTATIRTAGHTIVVAPRQVTVDGTKLALIEPTTKSVNVTSGDGAIEFVGDGRLIATWSE